MKYLIYPTVQLFLYDLRESLGDTPDKIAANWDNFRLKLPAEWRLYRSLSRLQETLNLAINVSQKYNIDVDCLADQTRTIAITRQLRKMASPPWNSNPAFPPLGLDRSSP